MMPVFRTYQRLTHRSARAVVTGSILLGSCVAAPVCRNINENCSESLATVELRNNSSDLVKLYVAVGNGLRYRMGEAQSQTVERFRLRLVGGATYSFSLLPLAHESDGWTIANQLVPAGSVVRIVAVDHLANSSLAIR